MTQLKCSSMSAIVFFLLICPFSSFAGAGPGGTGGGDPKRARRDSIIKFVNQDLKSSLFAYLDQSGFKNLPDRRAQLLLQQMLEAGLKEDITQSPYSTNGNCHEGSQNRPASTEMGKEFKPTSKPVCFDPELLAEENVSKREIIALALHEHAHHFGIQEAEAVNLELNIAAKYREPGEQNKWSCSATCTGMVALHWYSYFQTSQKLAIGSGETAAEAFQAMVKDCYAFLASKKPQSYYSYRGGLDQIPIPVHSFNQMVGGENVSVRNSCVKN